MTPVTIGGERPDQLVPLPPVLREAVHQHHRRAVRGPGIGDMDRDTATTLGLYTKAKTLADERRDLQGQLVQLAVEVPDMPSTKEIARRASEQLTRLDKLLESGSLEEKRELVRTYVKRAKIDPKAQTVELSVIPALFSWIGTGG